MYASVIIMYIAVGLAVPTFSAPISTSSAVRNVVPESQGSGDLGAREPSPFTLPTSFSDFENDLDKIPGVSSVLGGPAASPAAGSSDLGAREPSPFTLPTSFSDFEDDLDKIPGVSGILGGTAAPPAESPAATQPKCTGVCA
ncbi:hypothetical protein PILCRDRAFT_828533 [Piloderma croceum F 1598]|uniref:Uncharacterized protein n=1 Tax=Piloderma croceum (strain F 1598) TaxID=765440 RepID=A0A0C3F227_PILCF|nr:hypothetical protein PILCRDRAFT_828533 [Piloderma croceum F 1598]